MTKLGFGKYADLDLTKVPEDYLQWLINSSRHKIAQYEAEIHRRELAEDADATLIERIIKTGYRELSKKMHPDVGGNTAQMQELNAAFEALRGKR
ncbi:MAG: putative quorum-sensing-regulated virulence factor [Candidatus Methylomirabilales bacterium]